MASTVIHLAVAKKVNEKLKLKDENAFLLGNVAPDIAKLIGLGRVKAHFITEYNSDIPDIDYFLSKYKEYMNDDYPYELGYFVHLLTDKLWFEEFLRNYVNDLVVTDKTGTSFTLTKEQIRNVLYNDYSNMNTKVLDYYNLDLSLFYQGFDFPETHIKEIPSEYFGILLEKIGNTCTLSSDRSYLLDIASITHFIEYVSLYCLDEIEKLK